MPGNFLPSKNSNDAPPPVETPMQKDYQIWKEAKQIYLSRLECGAHHRLDADEPQQPFTNLTMETVKIEVKKLHSWSPTSFGSSSEEVSIVTMSQSYPWSSKALTWLTCSSVSVHVEQDILK